MQSRRTQARVPFADAQVAIYSNADPPAPFYSDGVSTGSSCADSHQAFDYIFANEDAHHKEWPLTRARRPISLPAAFEFACRIDPRQSEDEFAVGVAGDDRGYPRHLGRRRPRPTV